MTDLTASPLMRFDPMSRERVSALVEENQRKSHSQLDRLFAGLMLIQWVAGIAVAVWLSPLTWIGTTSQVHMHVWMAVFLGGLVSALPIFLALRYPGEKITRHVIAASQVLWSAMFIHLSGGRIETHFHIFGSLAFLASYRDWRVLGTASMIVVIDHWMRGTFWPQSVFGIYTTSPYRWMEHGAWVAFEVIFLTTNCVRGNREMRGIAERQVALEQTNERVEKMVQQRTSELAESEEQYELAVSGSNDGLWDWDISNNKVYWSPRFKRMLGYESHEITPTTETLDSWLHAEDREPTLEAIRAHLEEHKPFDAEYRLRTKDGNFRWFRMRGQAVWDVQKHPTRMAGSLTDVDDRKQDELLLVEAKERAEQANQAKSEFLASMSHELRTPLNAIIGFTDGLLDRTDKHPLSEHQKNRLTRVKLAGQHLLSLINDVLDIAKVEAGEMRLSMSVFDPAKLAGEVADLTEALVAEKAGRVSFSVNIEEGLEPFCSDREKIKQILVNLLSNSVKFTDSGSVSLVVMGEGDRVYFSVEDTGKGIPIQELHLIFDKFHQVGGLHQEGGTGLGLALCKQFSELLGGVLNVRSVEGDGSTFTLSVPLQHDASTVENRETLKLELSERADGLVPSENRKVVLCVEDEPSNMLVLQDYLTDAGYHVIPLFDSCSAVEVAEARQPDLIVLDIMMPGLDGWELLRRLKQNENTRCLPVVLASAIEERDLGLSLGAADYLTKPIDKKRLMESLQICAGGFDSERREVAVVDDDSSVRDVLRDLLEDQGHSVRVFEDGAKFLTALEDWRPDAVMLDLMMPEIDGFAVVEAMQNNPQWRTIPTVILTAMILSSEQIMQLNRHVRRVIEKNGMSRESTLQHVVDFLANVPDRRSAA